MTESSSNPLLTASALEFGLPDYRLISPDHYLPAFSAAFAEQRAEIDEIAASAAEPTFENTIEAWERSGATLARVAAAFYTVSSADADADIQRVDEQLSPLMAAHRDAISLDARLYARVTRLHQARERLGLAAEQRDLLERRFTQLTHAGAGLDDETKAVLRDLNQRLSVLTTAFEKNLLADTNELAAVFESREELAGLTDEHVASLSLAAERRGLSNAFLVDLTLFTGHPLLAALENRSSRRRLLGASRSRGARDGRHDNRPVLLEIVRLRAERARLLGYDSHAAYVTSDQTAGSPGAVRDLLRRLAAPAARNAARERTALLRAAADRPSAESETDGDADGDFELEASDWAYLTERVRTATLDIDSAALRPWFEAERVLVDGVFFAATRLYGVTFSERRDLPAYHPGARVFEVREADGSPLGLYVLDLYTRDTKRGGAWMNSIVSQARLRGTSPVVVNNLNVPQPAPGSPTLLTLDEVTTLFHEFGHALHGLFATVTYPSQAGTNVFRDFVEFPSQVNEMWILEPEVLANYARHVDTGEPLPHALVERLRGSGTFNQGFATSEYLAAAWLDLAWHDLSPDEANAVTDVAAFEAAALADIGLDDPAVPPRYSSTYFAHVFSGGYSAGYYSYIWSEVLDADTVEWFAENGGLTRANGDRFRERLLGVGGSKDPLEAYRDFRGRDAVVGPLLTRRGLSD